MTTALSNTDKILPHRFYAGSAQMVPKEDYARNVDVPKRVLASSGLMIDAFQVNLG